MNMKVDITYPAPKGEEVGKAFIDYLQANPIPDYVKLVEVYQFWGGEGLSGHVFWNLEEGKEGDGMRYITALTWAQTKAVDGYKVLGSTVVTSMVEAYEYTSMDAPEV
jgi:hypothetical protein